MSPPPSLGIVWLRNPRFEEADDLTDPDVAQETVEDLEATLEQFRKIVAALGDKDEQS